MAVRCHCTTAFKSSRTLNCSAANESFWRTNGWQITRKTWMLDPYSEGIQRLCYAVGGHFAGMVWVHLSPYREGSLQINTKLFWVFTYDETFLSWWGVVSSRKKMFPSTGHEGPLNGLMRKWLRDENDVNHILWPSQSPVRVRQRSPSPSSKHQIREYLLEEWCSSLQQSFRDLLNQCQGALKLFWLHEVAQHLSKTLHVGFSFNLSPFCVSSRLPGVSAQPGCMEEKWISLCWEAHLSVRITCCLCQNDSTKTLQQTCRDHFRSALWFSLSRSPLPCSERRPWCRQTSPSQTAGHPRSASGWACRLTTPWSGRRQQ